MATVNFSSYAASSTGLLNALAAIKTAGGKIFLDQDATLTTQVAPAAVSGWTSYVPVTIEGDGAAILQPEGISGLMLYFNGNVNRVHLHKFNVLGDTSGPHTSGSVLGAIAVEQFIVEKINMARVACGVAGIQGIGVTDMIVRDASFGPGGTGVAMVFADGCKSLVMENIKMYDYLNYKAGLYENLGYTNYWIKAVYSGGTPSTTSGVPKVSLRNVTTDEGTHFGYFEGYRQVYMEGCSANCNGATPVGQASIHLKSVQNALIVNHWSGYTANDVPAFRIENCGYVEINNLILHNGVNRILLDANTTFLRITNSPGVIVEAADGAKYELNGVQHIGSGRVQIGR